MGFLESEIKKNGPCRSFVLVSTGNLENNIETTCIYLHTKNKENTCSV